jgi:flagellar hook-associated protein 2
MATNPVSLFRPDDPYEMLIANMVAVERGPQTRLKSQRNDLERMKGVMTDANSKLSALHTVLKTLTDEVSNPFTARSVNVGETTAFTATATDTAAYGSHTLKIERLARTDSRISSQHTAAGTSLRTFFDANGGTQTFTVRVASPTDADPDNRVDVSVIVAPEGDTDKEILGEIATAINDAMNEAVADGTIESSETAQAALINETSTTSRLSLRSGQTGYTNRLEFVDSAAGLLSALELTNNAVASGTGGGQITAVGTSETNSELNSKFVLDGLTLYRSSNTVSDAIDGLTLELKQVTAEAADFSVEVGSESIKKDIESFIAKYNDILKYIATKTNIDPEAKTRGDLANDHTFSGLRFSMRNDVARQVSGQPAGGPSYLSDLGITIGTDGTLSLTNASKLESALRNDGAAVQNLFAGPDGIAQRLTTRIENLVGTSGVINARKTSMDQTLKRLDTQIANWDDRLSQRENQLRQQFAKLQEAVTLLQSQQQSFLSYFG